MPRSLKMATAAGDKASEINTRGANGLLLIYLRIYRAERSPPSAEPLRPGERVRTETCGAAVDPWRNHAASARSPLVFAKAKSSQGVSASMSLVSTVAPHQIR